MMIMTADSLGLGEIKEALAEVLESAGFSAMEEYTDIVLGDVEGCTAVWALDSVRLVDAGKRIDSGDAAVSGEIVFRVKLMGKAGRFGDHNSFDDRCFEACAGAAMIRDFGAVTVELGASGRDMQSMRLVREMKVVFGVCMKQVSEDSGVV
ncbi:hypothetical protein [Ruminococcus albus]|uniref:Uncharacterized protein n=1 Tax=Ruminococcus albus TaxID=1264 RepID=A0A1H7PWY9_RUMAL|nr:hypothetical protein [Ruminococcus albus]SEL40253.1 hypothetical protein SAMN05216469_12612 [Ruminococcus albus]